MKHLPGDHSLYSYEELVQEDRSWTKRRNCAGMTEKFFNEGRLDENPTLNEDNMEAIRICLGCEVRKECLIECASSDDNWRFGIWAGTTPGTRKQYIRRGDVIRRTFDFKELDKPMSYRRQLADAEVKVLTQEAS